MERKTVLLAIVGVVVAISLILLWYSPQPELPKDGSTVQGMIAFSLPGNEEPAYGMWLIIDNETINEIWTFDMDCPRPLSYDYDTTQLTKLQRMSFSRTFPAHLDI